MTFIKQIIISLVFGITLSYLLVYNLIALNDLSLLVNGGIIITVLASFFTFLSLSIFLAYGSIKFMYIDKTMSAIMNRIGIAIYIISIILMIISNHFSFANYLIPCLGLMLVTMGLTLSFKNTNQLWRCLLTLGIACILYINTFNISYVGSWNELPL